MVVARQIVKTIQYLSVEYLVWSSSSFRTGSLASSSFHPLLSENKKETKCDATSSQFGWKLE